MPIYSSLYHNFIRGGSTFAKSITTHGYAQSVVAATHPHVINSQNRPVFSRRHTSRVGHFPNLQLHSAFHSERAGSLTADQRYGQAHGGLDAYFEALQKKEAAGEVDREWTQFEFPKQIEWKPTPEAVFEGQQLDSSEAGASDGLPAITAEEAAALAHIDAALVKEIEARGQKHDSDNAESHDSWAASRSKSTAAAEEPAPENPRTASPPVSSQSQSYASHLLSLSEHGRYTEIPAVFEAMLATGVEPIADAYNALLVAAAHFPMERTEVVSKVLDIYADMLRRQVSPNSGTFEFLVSFLATRSTEVSDLKSSLEDKRARFGGMDEPGKFMLMSHEFEHAILCEDDRLDSAIRIFDISVKSGKARYSAKTYHQLIAACAQARRVPEMLRLFGHLEASKTAPLAATFPAMISAFAGVGDLISAVECYNEYRSLAIANDNGEETLVDRLDAHAYAAVINAYVVSDKIEGAMKFFSKIISEYGVRAADIKDTLISSGFVQGFLTRGIYQEAFQWAQSLNSESLSLVMARIATTAADKDDKTTALQAYACLSSPSDPLLTPSIALLAMSVRQGDVASATQYWHHLSDPEMRATTAYIEPTTMYAIALIGSGQVAEGLLLSEMMFQRIRASEPLCGEEVDEAVDLIWRYMETRGIPDPREVASQAASIPQKVFHGSPYAPVTSASGYEDTVDPYAQTTDFKGSSLIADDLEGYHGRKGPRINEALNRLRNMRRAGKHPRYITYAKLISAAAREEKMDLCHEVLAMARSDIPLLPQYAVVRYGWSSILDAMVGACLSMGNRGRAEQYHQELLEMGCAPTANTFGLYITTLKDSTKMFDEASEAVRIFHRAKEEGVEPSSFLYNALIGKLGKARRIDDCLFYFTEMKALGIKPTSVTYGTIVNALCRVSDEKFAEEQFDEMEAMPNYKARPAPYNSMMQFFLTTKREKAKVLAYYERMKSKGISPTAHTYKLLIDTHATLEPVDLPAAEQVFAQMRTSGLRPEPVHYASLIHALGCVLQDMKGARRVFDSVLRQELVPIQSSLYQALFEAMVANHCVADTEQVLEEMRSRKVELTPYIANTLIHGWGAARNIQKAQEIYQGLGREKREPSTYEAMTRAFLTVEQREQAKGVVSEMLTRGYPSAVVNKVLELLGGSQEASLE